MYVSTWNPLAVTAVIARVGVQQCVNNPPCAESKTQPSPCQKARDTIARENLASVAAPACPAASDHLAILPSTKNGPKKPLVGEHLRAQKFSTRSRFHAGRTSTERGLWEEKISTPPLLRRR